MSRGCGHLVVQSNNTFIPLVGYNKTYYIVTGLSNPEEFSFSLDEGSSAAAEQKTKTSTIVRDQKKLDAMKKRLHTDDELAWLNHDKSLREQGIDETQMLVLRLVTTLQLPQPMTL